MLWKWEGRRGAFIKKKKNHFLKYELLERHFQGKKSVRLKRGKRNSERMKVYMPSFQKEQCGKGNIGSGVGQE